MVTRRLDTRAITAIRVAALIATYQGIPSLALAEQHNTPSMETDCHDHPWHGIASSENDVGCISTRVKLPHRPGESYVTSSLYTRPTNLDVEKLSDAELESCGLPQRRGLTNASKDSVEYQSWLSSVLSVMSARQITGDLRASSGEKRHTFRPTPPPRGFHDNHVVNDKPNSVSPAGYSEGVQYNFAGRSIENDSFIMAANAGNPSISATFVVGKAFDLPTISSASGTWQTERSSWVGYQEGTDSGYGGTSLGSGPIKGIPARLVL